jgi:hypothetical protein
MHDFYILDLIPIQPQRRQQVQWPQLSLAQIARALALRQRGIVENLGNGRLLLGRIALPAPVYYFLLDQFVKVGH